MHGVIHRLAAFFLWSGDIVSVTDDNFFVIPFTLYLRTRVARSATRRVACASSDEGSSGS